MSYVYRLMDSGERPPENQEPLTGKARKFWLEGAPADVLQVEFRDGSRKNLSTIQEVEQEPLEPEDGSYWADLSPVERKKFYVQDELQVRLPQRCSYHYGHPVCPG